MKTAEALELKATRYAVAQGIATVTLHRPDRLNAWTGRMHHEYRWCIDQAERDPAVRAVIVTGAGRGFCAGADAKALDGHVRKGGYDPGTPAQMPNPGYGVHPAFDANFAFHFGLSKPVVAAINGPAAGVGLVLACFADLRFAVPGVKFTTAHGKLNLPAEYGLSWLLPRLIGLTRANDLMFTSRTFTSDEAFELGLLNGLVAPDELLAHTRDYVGRMIASVSPASLAATKAQMYLDFHRDVGASVADSEARLHAMMRQPDYAEAVRAFNEKRVPRWGTGGDQQA